MKKHRKSEKIREQLLQHLASGKTVVAAAKACGIGVRTATDWRAKDPAFAAQWEEAYRTGVYALEAEAQRRAVEGTDKPVIYKGQLVYHIDPQTGEPQPLTVKEYSDVLLMMLMKSRDPLRYCERARTASLTRSWGKEDGTPQNQVSLDAIVQAVAALEASKAALADHGHSTNK